MNRQIHNALVFSACAIGCSIACCAIFSLFVWVYFLNLTPLTLAYLACAIAGAIFGVIFIYPNYEANPFMPLGENDERY